MARRYRRLVPMALLGALVIVLSARGGPPAVECPPVCEPGYRIVEDICYQEVKKKVCRMVPEVKQHKKRVFDVKCEDYCLPKCPCPLCCGKKLCGDWCPLCGKPRTKQLLLKKDIVVEEVISYKCVVEEVVELVPYKVYRQVPCPPAPK